jgi:NitT/TauT family transport system permease protein
MLLGWQLAAWLAASRLLPGPAAVAASLLREGAEGELARHLGITLARVGGSFALAMLAGTALGLAMGRLPGLDAWARLPVTVLLNLPALVLIILCYLWLGLTEAALLAAVALNKIPNVAVTVREGARALDRDLLEVAAAYRFGAWRTLWHVVLPQLAPFLVAAARNGLALIWKVVLVVELLGRGEGVGVQLHLAFQMFEVERVLAYAAAFVACVLVVEATLLQPLERRVARWRR